MRETDFIGQNKEKWVEFERVLHSDKKDAERLSRLFIETTDDLSFSRTYYPNRSVRVYLNGVAQQVYQKIYRNRKRDRGAFKRYWTQELPDAMWFARKEMLISFLVFVFGFIIGMLSSAYSPDFVEIILSEYYVEMTEENIANGDPMAVYGQRNHLETFLTIAWNNIRVGFLCFVLGLLLEAGTIFIILSNAVMVGAFIWFFVQRDLFWDSFYAIMLHGSLELSMIVLAGAAGLVLGRGLVFPGSYSRLQAFLLSARHGMRIMIGVSAFLVVAAFIEGFATRYTEAPNLIRGSVILLSFAIVIGYFVWYPWQRYRQGLVTTEIEDETMNEKQDPVSLSGVKSTGMVINQSWRLYTQKLGPQISIGAAVAAIFTVVLYVITGENYAAFFDISRFDYTGFPLTDFIDGFWFWDEANDFFIYGGYWLLFPVTALLFGFVLWRTQQIFPTESGLEEERSHGSTRLHLINAIFGSFILLSPFLLNGINWGLTLGVFLVSVIWWPFWLFVLAVSFTEKRLFFQSVGRSFKLLSGLFGQLLGLTFMQIVIMSAIVGIASAPLFYLIFQVIGMNFAASLPWADDLMLLLHTFMMIFTLAVVAPVLLFTFMVQYHSNHEAVTAEELKNRIAHISFKKRAYGLEKEF